MCQAPVEVWLSRPSALGQPLQERKAAAVPGEQRLPTGFGFDAGGERFEDALEWAAQHGLRYLELAPDKTPNALDQWPPDRVRRVRERAEAAGVVLGLHPSSAVNVAETNAFFTPTTDAWMDRILELGVALGCRFSVVHGGYAFGSDLPQRREAGVRRVARAVAKAAAAGISLWLENHNPEPAGSEITYLPVDREQLSWFFDAIDSPFLGLSLNVIHAHQLREGWAPMLRQYAHKVREVRIADNRGFEEEHLAPGRGNLDFPAVFAALRQARFHGPVLLAFAGRAEKLAAMEAWRGLV